MLRLPFRGKEVLSCPGRWHAGVRVVYTATSIALASHEVLINLNAFAEPKNLVCIEATLPAAIVPEQIELKGLPDNWQQNATVCRSLGMQWYRSSASVALLVPSAAVMGDWNVLLNPEHADFSRIALGKSTPFRFDPRMFRHA